MNSKSIVSVVLDFLNQMEIYKVLTGLVADIYNIIRNELIVIFSDADIDKLFEIMTNYDELYIDYLEKRAHIDKAKSEKLRNKILNLYKEKIEKEFQEK